MSPSSMENEWRVPSMDHDTGVKLDQNPDWPMPGAEWLTVRFFYEFLGFFRCVGFNVRT